MWTIITRDIADSTQKMPWLKEGWFTLDRDVNAALNILWVRQTQWGKCTDNGLRLPQEALLL
jgi:hypothetical protein